MSTGEDAHFERMLEEDMKEHGWGGYDKPDTEPQVELCDHCDNFNPITARICSKCGMRLCEC